MITGRIKYEDVREGDRLALSGIVEPTASAGLGVRIGDHVIPLRDMAKEAHEPLIRVGDLIRPKGSDALGGSSCGTVTAFVDDAGKVVERGSNLIMKPDGAMSPNTPMICKRESMERIPLSELKDRSPHRGDRK